MASTTRSSNGRTTQSSKSSGSARSAGSRGNTNGGSRGSGSRSVGSRGSGSRGAGSSAASRESSRGGSSRSGSSRSGSSRSGSSRGGSSSAGSRGASSRGSVDSAKREIAKAGSSIGSAAKKAKTPLVAGGAAAAGLATGTALGALLRGSRRPRVLGLPMPRGDEMKAGAHKAVRVGRWLYDMESDLRLLREQAERSRRQSPIEVLLSGLTSRTLPRRT